MSTPEKESSQDLTAARNEISTQGDQIARLLASNKEWQEKYAHQGNNLTAMIDQALQKSKEADAYRNMLETLKERGSRTAQTGRIYTPTALWINDLLEKYPSPPTNKDIQ